MHYSSRQSLSNIYRNWLLVKVGILLVVVRVLLWLLPTRWLMRSSATRKARLRPDSDYEPAVRAINRVGSRLKFTCLEQALGGKWLLRRYQHVQLHIGVQLMADGRFEAHAWLVISQKVVLGADQQAAFTPILVL